MSKRFHMTFADELRFEALLTSYFRETFSTAFPGMQETAAAARAAPEQFSTIWSRLDAEFGRKGYSRKHFFDVTVARHTPEWPAPAIASAMAAVREYVLLELARVRLLATHDDFISFRADAVKAVLQKNKLDQQPFPLKAMVDRLRNCVAASVKQHVSF